MSVNGHGELEFDILAERIFEETVEVKIANAATNKRIASAGAHFYGWRTAPIPASVDGGPPRADFPDHGKAVNHYMKWEAPAGWKGFYIIESAPEGGNGGWQPWWYARAPQTDSFIGYGPWSYFPDYRGPVKLRVVPVSPTPP